MGSRSTRELVGSIAATLENHPKSIQEISEEVNADPKCVRQYLEALTNLENVKEVKTSDKRERGFCRSKIGTGPEPPEPETRNRIEGDTE